MPAQVDWVNERQWHDAIGDALSDWDSDLRENMVTLSQMAYWESYIRCPVKTGLLRSGIQAEVEGEGAYCSLLLFDHVEYAPHVEFGTRFTRAQPFLRPGLAAVQAAYERLIVRGLK
jgi:hypothetical protein